MFLKIVGARSAEQSGIKGVKKPFDPNILYMIPGSKDQKSGASLLAGGFLTLGPVKNMVSAENCADRLHRNHLFVVNDLTKIWL